MRFVLEDEEKTEKYREHLDWHFRQNRRERDEMKVAKYRQWYYGVNVSNDIVKFAVKIGLIFFNEADPHDFGSAEAK